MRCMCGAAIGGLYEVYVWSRYRWTWRLQALTRQEVEGLAPHQLPAPAKTWQAATTTFEETFTVCVLKCLDREYDI